MAGMEDKKESNCQISRRAKTSLLYFRMPDEFGVFTGYPPSSAHNLGQQLWQRLAGRVSGN
jgi:hypothetical protein